MAVRKCDRCGGKSSPWIPRKRNATGEMLCAGCAQHDHGTKTAELDHVPDRQVAGSASQDVDYPDWDNGLAPEGYHPLMAPLPNSVWERYAKRQELRGRPLIPNASQRIIDQRMTQQNSREAALRVTADEHPQPKTPDEIKQHLMHHHDFEKSHVDEMHNSDGIAGLQYLHTSDHDFGNELGHTHAKKISEQPHPQGEDELHQHLHQHHPVADWELDLLDHDGKTDLHDQLHHGMYIAEKPNHKHITTSVAPAVAPAAEEKPGKDDVPLPHAAQGLINHLGHYHGLTPQQMDTAVNASDSTASSSHVLSKVHEHMHSIGHGVADHVHSGWDENGFLHPKPHGDAEHIGHLKHMHGLEDEHLEGHDPEALHQKLHDETSSESATWGDPLHKHSVHSDIGKPFAGTPNSVHFFPSGHMLKDHGVSPEDLNEITANGSVEEFHDQLHKQLGENADHQHVPTTKEGVKSKQQVIDDAVNQHLAEHHGVTDAWAHNPAGLHHMLHDPGYKFDYKGHPGHEHAESDSGVNTEISKQLPKDHSGHSFHFAHPAEMDHGDLAFHLMLHHGSDDDEVDSWSKSHEQLLKEHAKAHATGSGEPHTHEISTGGKDLFGRKLYGGHEPEPTSKTHPAIEDESGALAHIIQHHPNISVDNLKAVTKTQKGPSGSMMAFHDALHDPKSAFPSAPDDHDHAEKQGPETQIAVGAHLKHDHGLTHEQVAAMTPAEFKAHHEELHARHDEVDLGHGHDHPGGPVRAPRPYLPNTHHVAMRGDMEHPATTEWYHGTGGDFEGAPKNATELMEDHSRWGNFGGGDWNNHAGTHWTSLHEMARDFNDGGNRVIHAKLHIKNPITYNSLNHMSHDAYERLRASGDMEDDGHFHNNHSDDSGYNHCCSDRLLEYAKGGLRSDGKYGMERYRDSLRASGHDGILVRNQADAPTGHWNAIPLSSDQIEITHASCHGNHHDERDEDSTEFRTNSSKLKEGWVHPKEYSPSQYTGGKELPTGSEVNAASHQKTIVSPPRHLTGRPRKDYDPLRNGRSFDGVSNEHDEDDDSDEHYCDHCEEWGDHTSDDCDNKWCSVCDEHGNHTASDEHDYCDHCNDYADHDSEDHEDEWGEHPDFMKKEGYCPHCETATKHNYGESECTNCGETLPDWGHVAAHGKAVKPEEYKSSGEAPSGKNYSDVGYASKDPDMASVQSVSAHLYHHHKSDVGGKGFMASDGTPDLDAINYHHMHLHSDPAWAKGQGFTVDHAHKKVWGEFKSHESMTPEETHAHLLVGHSGGHSTPGLTPLGDIAKMSPAEAVEHHKKLHAADDAIPWGETDHTGDLKDKLHHHHQMPDDAPTLADPAHSPKGDELMHHMFHSGKHLGPNTKGTLKELFTQHPGVTEALHQQLHDSFGPATEGTKNFHTHTSEDAKAHQQMHHLLEEHGYKDFPEAEDIKGMSPEELSQFHQHEHPAGHPSANGELGIGNHSHEGEPSVPGGAKEGSLAPTLTDLFAEATS